MVENSTKILTVDGRTVDKVNVSNYDTVNVGDVLFTLKPVENTDDLTELQTQLTTLQREATYAARTPATDNGVQAARDAVTAAQQTLNDAQNTLTQANGKAATIAAAQQTINDKNAALTAAEAEVTSASATVESLQSQMDQIDTEIAPLQSQVDVYVALGTPIRRRQLPESLRRRAHPTSRYYAHRLTLTMHRRRSFSRRLLRLRQG